MTEFHLQIVTPDGISFDGMAESLLVKCEEGDVEILAKHADYFASLGTGRARIKTADGSRLASASGGFLSVTKNKVCLVATTFEFADEIDLNRAKAAKERAEKAISIAADDRALKIAKAKLARALNRINIVEMK